MTRIVVRVLAYLLLGAVANIALAWACVAWSPTGGASLDNRPWDSNRGWPVPVPDDWWTYTGPVSVERGFGMVLAKNNFAGLARVSRESAEFEHSEVFAARLDAGWPWRSLTTHYVRIRRRPSPPFLTAPPPWECALEVRGMRRGVVRPLALPCRPVWPGFLANTLLFGVLLGTGPHAISLIRRQSRIKRHLCPVCAHPIGTSPVCTECGAAVRSRLLDLR